MSKKSCAYVPPRRLHYCSWDRDPTLYPPQNFSRWLCSSDCSLSKLLSAYNPGISLNSPSASCWIHSKNSKLLELPSSARRLSDLVWGLLLPAGWCVLGLLGDISLFSIRNRWNQACQNIVLSLCRLTEWVEQLNTKSSYQKIVVGDECWPTVRFTYSDKHYLLKLY